MGKNKSKGWVGDRDALVEGCDEYLRSLHIGTWGQAFDMFQGGSRQNASEFLADAMLGVVQQLEGKSGD